MTAGENEYIAADEMEDQTCDQTCYQTRQNSAGQVSNSENKVHTFTNSKFKTLFKIKRNFRDYMAKLQNG